MAGVGLSVVLHQKWFIGEAPDPEWIAKCGQENWIILTGDKSIERVPENRQAVINYKCKVFFFDDSNSLPEEWAAAVIVGRVKVFDLIAKNNGPFFVTLSKYARGHVSTVRFVGSGGPKPVDTRDADEQVKPKPTPPTQIGEPQQRSISFPKR